MGVLMTGRGLAPATDGRAQRQKATAQRLLSCGPAGIFMKLRKPLCGFRADGVSGTRGCQEAGFLFVQAEVIRVGTHRRDRLGSWQGRWQWDVPGPSPALPGADCAAWAHTFPFPGFRLPSGHRRGCRWVSHKLRHARLKRRNRLQSVIDVCAVSRCLWCIYCKGDSDLFSI